LKTWLRVSCCFLLSLHVPCLAQQVFVKAPGGREGRGIARSRYQDCFVIAPWHVIQGKPGSVVVGEKGIQAEAEIAYDLQSDDITILKLTPADRQICSGSAWPPTTDLEQFLKQGGETLIRSRNPDGSLSQIQVTVEEINDTFLTLLPGLTSKPITEGLSGSSVILNGRLVGLLLSTGQKDGRGTAVRLDFLDTVWKLKAIPPDDACLKGCSLQLSQLKVAAQYQRACQALGTSIQCQKQNMFSSSLTIGQFFHFFTWRFRQSGSKSVTYRLQSNRS
jgi:hypothetical protein